MLQHIKEANIFRKAQIINSKENDWIDLYKLGTEKNKLMKYSKEAIELEYYIKENISPVHYKIKNLKKHFEIRNSLYRLLGIIPNFLKGKDILEVAPGSGHNSIYGCIHYYLKATI